MKRLTITVIMASAVLSSALFADTVIPATSLPQNVKQFIDSNFKNANIAYVEQDYDSFEVRLTDGTKVDLRKDGNWKEIESYNGVNPSVLPANVAQTIAKTYPNISIIKIEKEWNGFEVKLANNMELYLDLNGNLLGQKQDD